MSGLVRTGPALAGIVIRATAIIAARNAPNGLIMNGGFIAAGLGIALEAMFLPVERSKGVE